MKKRMLALALSFALLSGCAAPAPAGGEAQPSTTPAAAPAGQTEEDFSLGRFPLDLLQKSRAEGENTLVSPLSALLCLSLAANGAAGETLDQLLALLGDGCTLEALNAACAPLPAEYAALPGDTTLELANGLWLAQGFQGEKDYLERCKTLYAAQVSAADFHAPQTVDEINAWVSEKTHGKIEELLDLLDPATAAVLVNALYLDAKWARPFEADDTREESFYPAQGEAVKAEFMHSLEQTRYFTSQGETGVVLPYSDGRLAFVAVLPARDATLADCLSSWDGDRLNTLLDSATEQTVDLALPKFEVQWSGDLTDTLKALGLTAAFDPEKADFSPMGATAEGSPVYLSQVVQKTAIRVDEAGTEAAAATAAIAKFTGRAVPLQSVTLTLDRPFLYAVVDLDRGVPLFLGTYETP